MPKCKISKIKQTNDFQYVKTMIMSQLQHLHKAHTQIPLILKQDFHATKYKPKNSHFNRKRRRIAI